MDIDIKQENEKEKETEFKLTKNEKLLFNDNFVGDLHDICKQSYGGDLNDELPIRWKPFRNILLNKALISHLYFPDFNGIQNEYNKNLTFWNPNINSLIMSLKSNKFRNLNQKNNKNEINNKLFECIFDYFNLIISLLNAEYSSLIRIFNDLNHNELYNLLWIYLLEIFISSSLCFLIGCNDMRFTNCGNIHCNLLYDHIQNAFIPMYLPPKLRFKQLPLNPRKLKMSGGILCGNYNLIRILILLSLLNKDADKDVDNNNNNNNNKYICSGTLIILPDNNSICFCKNVMMSYGIFDKYHVIIIETSKDHRILTYSEMCQSDFILISSKYLKSTHYQDSISRKINIKNDNLYEPNLSLFYFYRVILFYAEKYIKNKKLRECIMSIESKYGWYVSDKQPFIDRQHVGFCCDFLEINFVQNNNKENDENENENENENEIIVEEWNQYLNTPTGYVLHRIMKDYLFSKCIDNDNNNNNNDSNHEQISKQQKENIKYTKIFSDTIKRFIDQRNLS